MYMQFKTTHNNDAVVQWIPSHQGIEENKETDKIAKEEAKEFTLNFISTMVCKRVTQNKQLTNGKTIVALAIGRIRQEKSRHNQFYQDRLS